MPVQQCSAVQGSAGPPYRRGALTLPALPPPLCAFCAAAEAEGSEAGGRAVKKQMVILLTVVIRHYLLPARPARRGA